MHPNLFSLIIFVFVISCSPGPNNLLASYSSFNFGIKKTIPLMLGVIFGFTTMVVILDIGLITIFNQFPIIKTLIKIFGTIFVIYLAYKISFSKNETNNIDYNPVKFLNTFFFQFVNPKGVFAAVYAISTFVDNGNNYIRDSIWVIFINFFFAAFSITFWCLIGKFLRNLTTSDVFIKRFNNVMSLLLLLSIILFYI